MPLGQVLGHRHHLIRPCLNPAVVLIDGPVAVMLAVGKIVLQAVDDGFPVALAYYSALAGEIKTIQVDRSR